MCGIFAYLNYLEPRTRKEILDCLIKGLQRLEYRGYDSAGVAIDGDADGNSIQIIRRSGKVKMLENEIYNSKDIEFDEKFDVHVGISHTRWATHGAPSALNSHPQRSDPSNEFVVVHNGIITNYKDVQKFLINHGYEFESQTDTEVISKLIKHIHTNNPHLSFRELVEQVIQQMEGAFALVFKSKVYPNECIATRRGSPLLVGIKSKTHLNTDYIPVLYSKDLEKQKKQVLMIDVGGISRSTCKEIWEFTMYHDKNFQGGIHYCYYEVHSAPGICIAFFCLGCYYQIGL